MPDQVLSLISEFCHKASIPLASVEAERGPDQFEIALHPTDDIERLINDTARFKILLAECFTSHGALADFSAKPLPASPGSGLHMHVHLEDAKGNVFFREGEKFSPLLLHAVGGLLDLMNPCMPIFAPWEISYERFTAQSNAPTTVSWGTNNRTVAVRLPTKPASDKHLEHRVAGSDADTGDVIAAILAGIHYGLAHHCQPSEPVYGDAALAQYNCKALAKSLTEAKRYQSECKALADYLGSIKRVA